MMNALPLAATEEHVRATAAILTGIRGVGAASVVLQAYASTVQAQADLQLDILPDLPSRQAKARDHAEVWLRSTNPVAMAALADVRDFANHVNVYIDVILPLALQCDKGDKSQLPTIIQGLLTLLRLARTKAENATDLVIEIQIYQTYIAADCAAFSWAETKVRAQLNNAHAEIAALRQQLADQNRRMNAGLVLIAAGAVSDIVGIYMMLFAASTAVASGGATHILLAAGIGLVASGTLAMAASAADIVDAQKTYSDTIRPLTGVELEVAAFDTVAHQIIVNVPQAQIAHDGATLMTQGWNGIVSSYSKTISELQQDGNNNLAMHLNTIKRDWISLGQQAKALIAQGNLPFQTMPVDQLTVES